MKIEVTDEQINRLMDLAEDKRSQLMARIKRHNLECDIREFVEYTLMIDCIRLQVRQIRATFASDFYKSG